MRIFNIFILMVDWFSQWNYEVKAALVREWVLLVFTFIKCLVIMLILLLLGIRFDT